MPENLFDLLSEMDPSEDIQDAEFMWAGGVGDLGDPEAANIVQTFPDYDDYIEEVRGIVHRVLGDSFTVYRSMSVEAYEDWESGADIGYIGVTLNPDVARAWKNLAMVSKDRSVVEFDISPESIVMRGKPEEEELVIDGNLVSFHTLRPLTEAISAPKQDIYTLPAGTKLYHGSPEPFSTQIRTSKKLLGKSPQKLGGGTLSEGGLIWFSLDPGMARDFARGVESQRSEFEKEGSVFYYALRKPVKVISRRHEVNEKEARDLNDLLGIPDYKSLKAGDNLETAAYRAHASGRKKFDTYASRRPGSEFENTMYVIWPLILNYFGADGIDHSGMHIGLAADSLDVEEVINEVKKSSVPKDAPIMNLVKMAKDELVKTLKKKWDIDETITIKVKATRDPHFLAQYRSYSQFGKNPIFWVNPNFEKLCEESGECSKKQILLTVFHEYGHVIDEWATLRDHTLAETINAVWTDAEEFAEDFAHYLYDGWGSAVWEEIMERYVGGVFTGEVNLSKNPPGHYDPYKQYKNIPSKVVEEAYQPDESAPEEGEFSSDKKWRQSHKALVADAIKSWIGSPTRVRPHMGKEQDEDLAGSGKQMRARANALEWEIDHNGIINPVPLYRGATTEPRGLESWSEKRSVANKFAKGHGKILTAKPGELKGIKVADYTGSPFTEYEWIAMPIKTLKESTLLEREAPEQHYYISTGAKENFYTLRVWFYDNVYGRPDEYGNVDSRAVRRDYFIQNLSTNKDAAIAKAKQIIGKDLSTDIEVLPIGERHPVDWSVFQTGKYFGTPVVDVVAKDKDYAIWFAESGPSSQSGTKELLQSLLKNDLDLRRVEREEKAAKEKSEMEKRKEVLTPLIQDAARSWSDFAKNLAVSMHSGQTISEKAFNILADILAKGAGRRNSKAYYDEYDRLFDDYFETATGIKREVEEEEWTEEQQKAFAAAEEMEKKRRALAKNPNPIKEMAMYYGSDELPKIEDLPKNTDVGYLLDMLNYLSPYHFEMGEFHEDDNPSGEDITERMAEISFFVLDKIPMSKLDGYAITHPDEDPDVKEYARRIRRDQTYMPPIVEMEEGEVVDLIDGYHRVEALRTLGIEEVWVYRNETEEEAEEIHNELDAADGK